MVVLGLSTAAATLVGNAVGAQRAWMPLVWRALGFMGGVQIPMAILLWCFPEFFASIFTTDPAVIELSIIVLRIGALFQFCDGVQVMLFAVTRAIGDVKWPFWAGLIAHWCIGLPLAYWLGEVQGGIAGVWSWGP